MPHWLSFSLLETGSLSPDYEVSENWNVLQAP